MPRGENAAPWLTGWRGELRVSSVGLAYRREKLSDWMFSRIDPLTGTELTFKLRCETGGAVLVRANGLIRNNLGRLSRCRQNSCCRLALALVFASFLFRAFVDVRVDQSWANYQVEKGI